MPGLEDLYREIILDHYRSPRNRGELPSPPARRAEGFNPLCGDEVVVYVDVDDDTLNDIRISGQGCSISQSSASLMSGAVKGKSLPEVRDLIRTFKAMMSIHEARLGDGETRRGRRAGRPRPRLPGRAGRSPGGGQVPGTHQVRHLVVEHPGPEPRRGRCVGDVGRRRLTRPAGPDARGVDAQQGVGLKGPVPGTAVVGGDRVTPDGDVDGVTGAVVGGGSSPGCRRR